MDGVTRLPELLKGDDVGAIPGADAGFPTVEATANFWSGSITTDAAGVSRHPMLQVV